MAKKNTAKNTKQIKRKLR